MSIKRHHLITVNNDEGWIREIVTLDRQTGEYSTLRENRSTYTATLIAGEDLGELRHYHGGDNRPKAGWVGIDATGCESPKYRTRREALTWILDQRDAAAQADGQDLTAEDYLEDEGERRGRESRIRFGIRTAEGEQEELARAARLSRQSARFHLAETERYLAEESLGYAGMHARFSANHAAKVPNDKVSADAAARAASLVDAARTAHEEDHEALLAESRAARAAVAADLPTTNLENRYNGTVHTIDPDQHAGRVCRPGARTTCGIKISHDRMEWTGGTATCNRCAAA